MGERPLILLSNDDGVDARGLLALRAALSEWAEVITVAPATEQSAGGHRLTLSRPLRHRSLEPDLHSIDGTPADCIYVALFHEGLLPRRPDLVASGINHGYNLGNDIFYSGTVAAAREAALRGFRALAFSLGESRQHLDHAAKISSQIARRTMAMPGQETTEGGLLLNVNFPPASEYKEIRTTRLGRRIYVDEVDVRKDPRGREYFWIGGPRAHHEMMEDSDTQAVDEGCVSITPLILEATDADGLPAAAWASQISEENDGG